MRISEEEQQRRKERIIQSAFHLFCESGIEQVSITDIAKKASVGETTVYRYFTNKPLLVLATLNVLWTAIGDKLEKKVRATKGYDAMTGFQQIAVQLESCRELYLENADYVLFSYETKLYLQRNSVQLTMREYDKLMEEIKGPFIEALEKGKADGTIPVTQDSEDIFYAIWGAVRGYIVKIVIYKALCRDEDPWQRRYSFLMDGILTALSSGWRPVDWSG